LIFSFFSSSLLPNPSRSLTRYRLYLILAVILCICIASRSCAACWRETWSWKGEAKHRRWNI
jgi:hypothetical protein